VSAYKRVLLLIFFTTTAIGVNAATGEAQYRGRRVVVAPRGSDSAAGTVAHPMRTVRAAR